MTRMNYGKRFGQGPVRVEYRYDEEIDKGMRPLFGPGPPGDLTGRWLDVSVCLIYLFSVAGKP